MQHDSKHEEILALLLSGERSAEDPEVVRLLSECAVCAEELRELQSLSRELDRAALQQRDVLADAPAAEADSETVSNMLGEVWAQESVGISRFFRPLAIAAGLLLLAGAFAFFRQGSSGTGGTGIDPRDAVWLSGNDSSAVLLEPVGKKTWKKSTFEFRWELSLTIVQPITLRAWDGDTGEQLMEETKLRGNSYSPSEEQRERLGNRIRWQLIVGDSGGDSYNGFGLLSD